MSVINVIEKKYKKSHVVDVRSGDTVKVHQKIREGSKERIQIFEGLVIRTSRKDSHTASITVRRIASGVGVEKTYLIHSPLVTKIQVVKRSKVRRNYLNYMRERTGKSARLSSIDFDQEAVNKVPEPSKEEKKLLDDEAEKPATEENKTVEKPEEKPSVEEQTIKKSEDKKAEEAEPKSENKKEESSKDDSSKEKAAA